MKRRILSLALVAALLFGLNPTAGYAQNADVGGSAVTYGTVAEVPEEDLIFGTGLIPLTEKEFEFEGEPACGIVENVEARAESEWDKYTNHYYYNQMNEAEKALYDRLDAVAYSYLTGTGDIAGAQSGYSDWISHAGLTWPQAKNVYSVFRYANPQYYFINSSYGNAIGAPYMAFGIYPAFISGSVRKAATTSFKSSVEKAVNSVLAVGEDPERRAQEAHDWIINKVQYSRTYLSFGPEEREEFAEWENTEGYTQSAYSTFCLDETVCAGYTQAFEMLCNAVGVDAVGVTSEGHAWNKVRLYGNWYEVDCTWDDPLSQYEPEAEYLVYDFFNRSEKYLESADKADGGTSHVQEEQYKIYNSPVCKYDSVGEEDAYGNRWSPGKIAETNKVTVKASAPKLAATLNGTTTTVTLSCETPGTIVYYYTLDGTTPSEAESRAIRAKGSTVTYTGVKTIKVVAVVDGYLESDVSSYTTVLPSYKVTFNTQNGSAVASQTVVAGELVKTPGNPTRKGYTFDGWYKDSACKQSWDFTADKITGDTTLYAKWTLTQYKITYSLKGGKNHKSNPSSYKITTKTITLKNPTRKGYLFKGWYSDSGYKKKVTKITKGSTGAYKLYAKWEKVAKPKKTSIKSLVNKKGKKMAVQIKKVSGASGYQIRYSTKSNMKSSKTVAVTSTKKTITKLKKGTTYYVQVRAYKKDSTGAKVTGNWSAKKKVAIKK